MGDRLKLNLLTNSHINCSHTGKMKLVMWLLPSKVRDWGALKLTRRNLRIKEKLEQT